MVDRDPADFARVLDELSRGKTEGVDALLPVVYDELHALAARFLRHERAGHTLQTTALVHEAYLRLVDQSSASRAGRTQFCALAARMMRRVLVDHAKARQRIKRGGRRDALRLDTAVPLDDERPAIDLVALDEALERLAELAPRQARIVELRYFGGLGAEETADLLDVSTRTLHREWSLARAWLRGELECGDGDG